MRLKSCIVQSYLQWLQDSDYNPNCMVCEEKLISEDCVRLVCLHVYHWKCLDKKYRQLPSTTAPAGYKCLQCEESIFPLSNLATPVADHLRDKLATVNWARLALGLPAVTEENNIFEESNIMTKPIHNQTNHSENSVTLDRNHDKDDLILYLDEPVYSRPEESAKMPRRMMGNISNPKMLLVEEDEKKDRRKYPLSWLSRWIREGNVMRRTQHIKKVLCDRLYTTGSQNEPDEVYPGIFIGDECSARDRTGLRNRNITHVVNAAAGRGFGMVNTNASYYADLNIKYLGIELSDLSVSDASRYFYNTSDFIDEALQNQGRVLVHCLMGISRSSTLVLAFLMLKRNMSAVEAVTAVRKHRNIHPNDGFITQLAALDIKIERARTNNLLRLENS
ncbi:zinc finger protein-like 1 isoform X2 [Rhodnius prolixus]|uniref:zinc finger protein-like 1 isoform X2 n=1 Tax=Rhodnius prolixus TaxID=13249 RepID=UPI003D18D7B2